MQGGSSALLELSRSPASAWTLRGAELSGGQRREVNAKGRAVTQRVEPSLALVEADITQEAFVAEEDWQPAPDSLCFRSDS